MTIPTARKVENPAELITAAENLSPLIRENAEESESKGQLTSAITDALHESRMFGMWTPKELGGSELDPVSSLQVIQTLAEADAATAWVTMAAALATGTGGAYLPDDAVKEMFQGERFPVVAGQGTRPGTAVRDGDGYRLSGDWNFASGIKHSQWIHTLGVVQDTGEPLIFVLPVDKAELVDNWDVMGLKATGSIDYKIRDVYVPAAFTHPGPTETPLRGGNLFTLGIMHFSLIGHSAWALGVARRMLNDLTELVHAKAGRPGTQADSIHFHAKYGEAEAKYYAARSFVHETWRGIGETVAAGEALTMQQKTLARLALYNATWSAEEISLLAYRLGGTTSLRRGPMQRYFRDMHAGTQHITSALPVVENCGRVLAGLAPDHDWLYMNIVPQGS